MAEYRKTAKNKILKEISDLQSKREHLESSIKNLRSGSIINDREFLQLQLKKNNDDIERVDVKIEGLREQIQKIDDGEMDDDLKQNIDNNMNEVRKKNEATQKKMEAHEKHLKKQKAQSERFFKIQYSHEKNRASEYEMQRAYERFISINHEIPNYMLENLKTMPNNKGYLWKGIYCFGRLPANRNEPRVIFEKQRGDVMYIHETIGNETHTYKKVGKEPKTYVSTMIRKKIT